MGVAEIGIRQVGAGEVRAGKVGAGPIRSLEEGSDRRIKERFPD